MRHRASTRPMLRITSERIGRLARPARRVRPIEKNRRMSWVRLRIADRIRAISVAESVRSTVGHWWPIGAQFAGTALLAVAGASPHATFQIGAHTHPWRPWLIGVGIVLLALGSLNTGRRQLRLERLKSERARFAGEAEAGARSLLRMIFHELDALRTEVGHLSSERVSLFRCDGGHLDSRHLILVGRMSANPIYDRSRGRRLYPETEGCLGRAWGESKARADDLPHPGTARPWSAEWIAAQAELGVPAQTAEALTMPSRSYFAFRIDGRERNLGVVVFESLNTSAEAGALSSRAALSFGELEPAVDRAKGRLAQLLRESEFIAADTITRLLPVIRE